MKKTIALIMILLLLPTVIADIETPEVESYKPPVNGIGYFIKITLPEFFISAVKFFDRDERINYKLEQLEKRKIEYEYLLQRLNKTQSEEWRQRYENMIRITSKRQEQNLKKLERYTKLVKKEKREKVKELLEQRDIVLNQLREKFTELENTEALKGIENAINQSNRIRNRLVKVSSTLEEDSNSAKKIISHGVS